MEIKIEKNIPLPLRPRSDKYPLAQLEVGDSFFAPIGAAALAAHARRFGKANQRKFIVRPEGDGSRVWRKA